MRTPFAAVVLVVLSVQGTVLAADNELSSSERSDGWKLLFNGKDLSGWKCSNGKPVATPVEDGSIVPYKSGGYLVVHEKPAGDFILKCDVRWEDTRCNSGIFLRVEDLKNPVHTGFEIQVMGGDKTGKHEFGAIYDLAPTTNNTGKPTGEWNTIAIRCKGPMITVVLNDEKVCELNCDDYSEPGLCPDGTKHKFKLKKKPRAVKDFARSGYFGFQDHGHKVWYRNIKLLELKD